MKKEKLRKEDNKGITLIALVITIIVLLILAAVTIVTLTGENGILTKANEATQRNNQSKAEEEVKLAIGSLQIEERQRTIGQDEKISVLEKELKSLYTEQQPATTISVSEEGWLISHRGNRFKIDNNYNVSYLDSFNAEEWDKKASNDDCFVWDGNTIIGYNEEALSNVTTLRIPSKCVSIKSNFVTAWDGYRNFVGGITKIEIPETITEIGDYAFLGFNKLEEIIIPDSVTTIGIGVFMNCTSLSNVTLSNNLKSIGDNAFGCYGIDHPKCESLKSIVIPDSVESIGRSAFQYCRNLESVTLSKNLKEISDSTFYSCYALTEVKNTENIEVIGSFAFYRCRINKIPENVKSIGNSAFSRCDLGKIIVPASVTSIGSDAFERSATNPIYCRVSSKPSGWSTGWNYWGEFGSDDEDRYYDVVWGYTGE